jgi:hypothetical protein
MPVSVYVDLDGRLVRLGTIGMTGSSTSNEATVNLPAKPARVLLNPYFDILSYK